MWRSVVLSTILPVLVILFLVAFQLKIPHKPRLVVAPPARASQSWMLVRDELVSAKNLHVVSTNLENALQEKRAEVIVSFPDGGKEIVLSYDAALPEAKVHEIQQTVEGARLQALKKLAEKHSIKPAYLEVFHIDPKPLSLSMDAFIQAIFDLVLIVLLRAAFSTNFAVQLVWSEEAQTKSLVNMLVLPVDRRSVMMAKYLIIVLLGILGSLVFFVGFALTVFFAGAISASASQASLPADAGYATKIAGLPWLSFLAMTCFVQVLLVILYGSVGTLGMIAFKERHLRSLVSFAFTIMALPLVAGFFPSAQLDARTEWMPTLNLALILKSMLTGSLQTHQWMVAIGESFLLIALINYVNLRFLSSERFMLNASE
jgi:ABC-type Na+ efflux pump permease subunit